ncbi:MFS transporter [Corynebacterium halotolerans]|uniref:MFS transporter n=1 Tax=Corynebacterium halotolerans TaxID=225326 RepID=UPI003CF03DE4
MPGEDHNARRFIWSNGLQNIGDQVVAAKTVLPWLLQSAGAPGFFIALLVPIRESGSMLPQAALTPWVTSRRDRRRLWVIGSFGQAAAAALIGVTALLLTGWALGAAVVVLLGVLSVFRALCSITSKDVQGRTIHKGNRGLITGRATALGGGVALAIGLLLLLLPGDVPLWLIALLIFGSAAAWFVAGLIFRTIREPDYADTEPEGLNHSWLRDCVELFTGDRTFRHFVIVRALLLVTALSSAFIVTLSQETGQNITGLGVFLIASGLAALVGGRISGIWSDASSKKVMAFGSLAASLIILVLVAGAQWAPHEVNAWLMPAGFFGVTLAHTSVRVARKTYVVDMAEGDQRTRYVSAANSLMGLILLGTGAISGVVALAGSDAALLFLAAVGLVGTLLATRMKEVSA